MDKESLITKLNKAEEMLSSAINELESVIADVEELAYDKSNIDREMLMDGLDWNMERLQDSVEDISKDIKYFLNKEENPND